MSAGLLGALAGVGPGMMERRESDERIALSKTQRTIAESQEGREKDKHEWLKEFGDLYGLRELVDNPSLWDQYNRFRAGQGPVAVDPSLAPQQPPVQQALPGINAALNPQPLPAMAEGGQVQVPAQPAAIPQQEAVPTAPPAPSAPPAGGNVPSRRERYNQWYNDTAKYAVLNGGLEGLSKFREMEDAASRRQVLGYALQAVDAMDKGNVGEAMRAGNAALEVTPFDTGLKFEARNGNLYMVGADGEPGKPLNADHLRAFTEDHMKTPETYLAWKEQYEEERSNKAAEKLRGREVAVGERDITLREELGPRQTAAQEAQAIAAMQSANSRLAAAIKKASDYGWSPSEAIRISDQVLDWSLNDFEAYNEDASEFYRDDPQAFNDLKSGVAQIMLSNPWDEGTQSGMVDPDLAATVYQLVTLPGSVNLSYEDGTFAIGTHPDLPGRYIANYKGRPVMLPSIMNYAAKKLAGAGAGAPAKEQTSSADVVTEQEAALPEAEASALNGGQGVIGSDPYGNPIINDSRTGSRKSRRG